MNHNLCVNKTNFHMKDFALGLALKQRRKATRKLAMAQLVGLSHAERWLLGVLEFEPEGSFFSSSFSEFLSLVSLFLLVLGSVLGLGLGLGLWLGLDLNCLHRSFVILRDCPSRWYELGTIVLEVLSLYSRSF